MKKIKIRKGLIASLSLLLCTLLASCGGIQEETTASTPTSEVTQQETTAPETSAAQTPTPTPTPTPTETPVETTAITPEPTAEQTPEPAQFTRTEEVKDAYDVIVEEYRAAASLAHEDYVMNANAYKAVYPNVDVPLMTDYHTPFHLSPGAGVDDGLVDEGYDLCYSYCDIDANGTPELLIIEGFHELSVYAVYGYDGEKAVKLLPIIQPSEEYTGADIQIYVDGTIVAERSFSDGREAEQYHIGEDGCTLVEESVTSVSDLPYNVLEYQYPVYEYMTTLAEDVPVNVDTGNYEVWSIIKLATYDTASPYEYTEYAKVWEKGSTHTVLPQFEVGIDDGLCITEYKIDWEQHALYLRMAEASSSSGYSSLVLNLAKQTCTET